MIRVFVGTEEKTNVPLKVLEHSILRHTSEEVTFYPMLGESWIKRTTVQGTGFSLQRWYIPDVCLFLGRAIYLDVDMLCFSDIAELWNLELGKASIGCTYQADKWFKRAPATSSMLIDCERAWFDWEHKSAADINTYIAGDVQRKNYIKLMHAGCTKLPAKEIPMSWNRFNKPAEPIGLQTKILHYTKEPEQPWYFPKHPYKDLWRDALIAAIKDGYVEKQDIKTACDNYRPHTCCERGSGMHSYWRKFAA